MDRICWLEIKRCQLDCELRHFLKALEIWVQKPHVVNRRLAAAITVGTVRATSDSVNALLAELSEKECASNCIVKVKKFLSTKRCWEDDSKTVTGEVAPFTELKLIVRKLIPKTKLNMLTTTCTTTTSTTATAFCTDTAQTSTCSLSRRLETDGILDLDDGNIIELAVFDFDQHTVTFLPLKDVNFARHAYKFSFSSEPSSSLILSLPDDYLEPESQRVAVTRPTSSWLRDTLLHKLATWALAVDPDTPISSSHALISVERYSNLYAELKQKYGPKFVKIWPDNTDPQKFVYEDVAIATYILLLWEQEREKEQLQSNQSFVDLGCGNGFLVHILNSEGHPGKGIDLRSRAIWILYGTNTNLEECSIIPSDKHLFPDTDWLIGNHSDELTPWIPVMAARSSPNTRYFVLPCCFHDFAGKFVRRNPSQSQYRAYLDFIRQVGEVCGFNVAEDSMRIPSTKRICQVGKRTNKLHPEDQAVIDVAIQDYISGRCPEKLLRKPVTNCIQGLSGMSSSQGHQGLDCNMVISNIDKHEIADSNVKDCKHTEEQSLTYAVTGDSVARIEDKKMQKQARTRTKVALSTNSGLVQGQWAPEFQPRNKVEAVRNCSRVSTDLKEMIVNDIAHSLLTQAGIMRITSDDEGAKKVKGCKLWRRGGKMTFQEVIALFDGDVLKQLKNECGGLKTLLKNANQVFEVSGNSVQLRDWSLLPIEAENADKKQKGGRNRCDRKKPIKSKQCWFYMHHPDGCPRLTHKCSFAHGLDDQQVLHASS